MSEKKLQEIKDVIKMISRLDLETLTSIRNLMEKWIDSELIRLESSVKLENMDITEKVKYLDYLTENEEDLKKEGLREENTKYITSIETLKRYLDSIEDVLLLDEGIGKLYSSDVGIEKILDEMDEEIANSNAKYYSHEEVFSNIRRNLHEE